MTPRLARTGTRAAACTRPDLLSSGGIACRFSLCAGVEVAACRISSSGWVSRGARTNRSSTFLSEADVSSFRAASNRNQRISSTSRLATNVPVVASIDQ